MSVADEIKKELILLIGSCIDEESLPNRDSFVEMDQAVIHCVADGERYFKVTLTETTEDEYYEPYKP